MTKELLVLSPESKTRLSDIKLVIFDIDKTLVFAKKSDFYNQYSELVEKAIEIYYEVDQNLSRKIAGLYRQKFGGGEQALFRGDAHLYFENCRQKLPNVSILYDLLTAINPTDKFTTQEILLSEIKQLKKLGIKIVALTSSPDKLSKKILEASGYTPESDFDEFIGYTRSEGPPKMISGEEIFQRIASEFNILPKQIISIGDSLNHDVLPAVRIGMLACLLTDQLEEAEFAFIKSASTSLIINEIVSERKK